MQATGAAADYIRCLEERIERFEEMRKAEPNITKQSVFVGWRDATAKALDDFQARLSDIESDARLIPENEEQYGSLRERLVAEEMAA